MGSFIPSINRPTPAGQGRPEIKTGTPASGSRVPDGVHDDRTTGETMDGRGPESESEIDPHVRPGGGITGPKK
jgi:hypothetical protein